MQSIPQVPAAGTLPWRIRGNQLEVAVIHRSGYDDWSWPKGKLDANEQPPVCAVRETAEETGLRVRLGPPLPTSVYSLGPRSGDKWVRYWTAVVVGGDGRLEHEVDQVVWIPIGQAGQMLTYTRDQVQAQALQALHLAGALDTVPLLIVRHSQALGRARWQGEDQARPLNRQGQQQALRLAPTLAAFGITDLISSPSLRCQETLLPYLERTGGQPNAAGGSPDTTGTRVTVLRSKQGLSEEGFTDNPEKALKHLKRALRSGHPTALCTHGPLLPSIFGYLLDTVDLGTPGGGAAARDLLTASRRGINKGQALIAQVAVAQSGDRPRVVSVERLPA